ncbi:MAG: phosphoribosylformylglycinamidine synthase-associated small membrane protein [Hyphomicrobiales bacterium]
MERSPEAVARHREETAKALKFMAIKAAVFIGIPVIASVIAVIVLL